MIQIDMQMPKNCLDCPACNEYLTCAIPVNGRKWGENDVCEFGQGRPEWCPLKEQEAVEPKRGFALTQKAWYCGVCGFRLNRAGRFCAKCGQVVKWDA